MPDNSALSNVFASQATSYGPSSQQGRLDKHNAPAEKKMFKASVGEWLFAIGFMLSMSITGLGVTPGWLLIIVLLINRWRRSREEFLLLTAVLLTSPAFIPMRYFPMQPTHFVVALEVIALLLVRKTKLEKKALLIVGAYFLYLAFVAWHSYEVMSIQIYGLERYTAILTFLVPLLFLAGKKFDIQEFFRHIIRYFLVICVFYTLDAYVLRGAMFVPSTMLDINESTFSNIKIFLSYFPRKYPHGMNIIILVAYPLARYYKLRPLYWTILLLGLSATRTVSLMAAFIATFVFSQGRFGQFLKWVVIGIGVVIVAYFADGALGGRLRIQSTVKQFTSLSSIEDDEDLAQFGSSRMAQVIPKIEAEVEQGEIWTGFGFINRELSKAPRYQIHNMLYDNPGLRDENVAMTEVSQVNTVLHTGIIGFVLQLAYLIGLYLLVRRRRDSHFYLAALLMAFIMGISGAGGYNDIYGLMWIGYAYGVVLMQIRRDDATLEREKHNSDRIGAA